MALLSYEPARKALIAAAPVMVDLIVPRVVEPPKPVPAAEPPKPKAVVKRMQRSPEPPPILAAPAEAPSPAVAPPAPPAPVESAAPPGPASASISSSQPVFNADYLDNPAPAYPAISRRSGEQGRVILRVLVNARGGADEVQVRTSCGYPRLDEAAREAVLRWRFVPAKRGAEPIAAWVLIPISFRLEG